MKAAESGIGGRRSFNAERELECAHDFRPELAQDVKAGIRCQVDGNTPACRARAALVSGMIGVAQCDMRGGPQPLGEVEHGTSAVRVRDKKVPDCMAYATARAAIPLAVVAGVLAKNDGESKGVEEVTGDAIGKRRAVTFAIAFGALAEGGIIVGGLGKTGMPTGGNEGDRMNAVSDEELKLFCRRKRANSRSGAGPLDINGLDLRLAGEIRDNALERPGVTFRNENSGRLNTGALRLRGRAGLR